MGKGWKGDSKRHALARQGVKTAKKTGSISTAKTSKVDSAMNSNRLPIQIAITVPSTKEHSKPISQEEFKNRINHTKKFMSDTYGGDTSVRGVGSYTDDGKLIKENVAVVESSTTNKAFLKNKPKLKEFIKDKPEKWGQDTIGYEIEGDFYVYPKKDYIAHEKKKDKKLQL